MIRQKKLVSLGLAACLLFSFPAQAEIIIPPIPTTSATEHTQESSEAPGASNGPGSGQQENAPGPGGSQQETTPGPGGGQPGTSAPPSSNQTGPDAGTGTKEIAKPEIQAEGAVLMDAATGNVLYGKDQDTKFFPASITKLMTALLVIERCNLDDTVTFSDTATTNLEAGAVSLDIVKGDKLTVRESLYALLLKSANEVGNGLAEHVAGSVDNFAKLMNEKAKALGCTNTNFVNPHGLNNSNHVTTPKDMALIARAAFQNETLRKISSTLSYQIPATQKKEARTITMGHKMMYQTDARYYPGIIGGKTGYTSLAGNTLVTAAERDGVRLIAVIMKSKSTHYADTKALLDYGFEVMAAGSQSSSNDGPGVSNSTTATSGWVQDSTGWNYIKPDGSRASNQWQTIDGEEYWFDSNAYMAIGWRQFSDGEWYYFRSSGALAKNYWAKNDGKSYYMGANGIMLKNTTTPDGYQVDAQGVWVE